MTDWKQTARERFNARVILNTELANELGVPQSTLWDFKQKLIQEQQEKYKPKIFNFDIETAPLLIHNWSLWQNFTNLNQIMEDWFMLSWAGKWLGEDEIFYHDLIQDKEAFNIMPTDDETIVRALWDKFNEADIIIGHNVKRFDNKKTKARFLKYGLTMPDPYKIIDTLEIAKREFALASNKLDWLATFLGLENKIAHEGHGLWVKCMAGDPEAWAVMKEYNIWDVGLLEEIYMKIRGWSGNHMNLAVFYPGEDVRCPVCGSINLTLQDQAFAYTNLSKFQVYRCTGCGKMGRTGGNLLSKNKRESLLRNIL